MRNILEYPITAEEACEAIHNIRYSVIPEAGNFVPGDVTGLSLLLVEHFISEHKELFIQFVAENPFGVQ